MDSPAQRLNLNIIKNVWLKLKRNLQNQVQHFTNIDLLMASIKTQYTINLIKELDHSIPRRLARVIKAKGCIPPSLQWGLGFLYNVLQIRLLIIPLLSSNLSLGQPVCILSILNLPIPLSEDCIQICTCECDIIYHIYSLDNIYYSWRG